MNFYQKPVKTKGLDPFEPIPCGECQETDWAAWEETVASQNHSAASSQVGQEDTATLSIDLPLWSHA
jgi:endogenous inhibitor of DNA gyrase (YacG/DUF329 family)